MPTDKELLGAGWVPIHEESSKLFYPHKPREHATQSQNVWTYLLNRSEEWIPNTKDVAVNVGCSENTAITAFAQLKHLKLMVQIEVRILGKGGTWRPYYSVGRIQRDPTWHFKLALFVFYSYPNPIQYYARELNVHSGEELLLQYEDSTAGICLNHSIMVPDGLDVMTNDEVITYLTSVRPDDIARPYALKGEPIVTSPIPDLPQKAKKSKLAKKESSENTAPDPVTAAEDRLAVLMKECKVPVKSRKQFTKLSRQMREDVAAVYLVWNSYKDNEPKDDGAVTKNKGSANEVTVTWKKHNALSSLMIGAIKAALTTHDCDDLCAAIDNYATTLFSPKAIWSHTWDLAKFFKTGEGKGGKDADRKWWRWLPEQHNPAVYLLENTSLSQKEQRKRHANNKGKPEESWDLAKQTHTECPDKELTAAIITAFKKKIDSTDYVPTTNELYAFRQAASNLLSFYKKKGVQNAGRGKMVALLMRAIQGYMDQYNARGRVWMVNNQKIWHQYVTAEYAAT